MASFLLFVVPSAFWDDRPRAIPPTEDELLREQLREANSLRERIEGGINLESERTRYTDTFGRVEGMLIKELRTGHPPGVARTGTSRSCGRNLLWDAFPRSNWGTNTCTCRLFWNCPGQKSGLRAFQFPLTCWRSASLFSAPNKSLRTSGMRMKRFVPRRL